MKDLLGFIIGFVLMFVWFLLLIAGMVATLELCVLGGVYFIGAALVVAATVWLTYAGCHVVSGGRI